MNVGIGFMATFLVIFIATVVLLTIASDNDSENWSVLIVILFSFLFSVMAVAWIHHFGYM